LPVVPVDDRPVWAGLLASPADRALKEVEAVTDRTTARAAGVLFVVGSAAAIIGGTLMVLPVEEAGTFADIAATEPASSGRGGPSRPGRRRGSGAGVSVHRCKWIGLTG
jgi:hypothetical protein